jgi:uncharacterized protein YjdB
MKQLLAFVLLLFALGTARAQVPNAIPYQAAARNSSGAILANANISVRFTIRDAVASGAILYRETHAVTTSPQGLFSVNVGQGAVVSGSFTGINWGVNHKFMQVEFDPDGGSSYIDIGTQQLLSIPYALFSGATRPTISSVGDTMYFGGGVYYIVPGISAANCVVSAGTITSAGSVCTGSNISLTSTVAGGVWSSSNPSVAPIVGGNILVGFSAGTTTVTYTVTQACGSATATAVITVNPVPDAGIISGSSNVCADQTTTLTSTMTGGTWTSSNTAAATVNSAGVVSGVSAGLATISYTVTNSCGSATATRSMSVNPLPFAGTISGTATVCIAGTTTLGSTGTGGTWSSSHATVATISPTGVVTGVTAGTAAISYKVVNSCGTATGLFVVTVNPLPFAGSVTGTDTVMMGGAITLSNLITSGTWSSSNTATATVGTTGIVNGLAVGSVTISYTVTNACGTGVATKGIYVRPLMVGDSYGGGIVAYILQPGEPGYTTAGMRGLIATPSDLGTARWGCTGTLVGGTSIAIGAGAANTENILSVCPTAGIAARICANLVSGGYDDWYLPSRLEMSRLYPNRLIIGGFASDNYWTSSEISSDNATIFDFSSGAHATAYKSHTLRVRAIRSFSLTCPETAGVISGLSSVCAGSTTTLTNAVAGGTWSSSATGIATVSAAGVVTGVAAGTATITYTITDTCGSATTTRVVTVNALPSAGTITGADTVAMGSTITLSNATTGGIWSSSNAAAATINSGGIVSGIATGTTIISYTVSNTCGTSAATKVITVRSLRVGDSYGGGIIAYILQPVDPGYIAGQFGALIAAPTDQGSVQWGCYGTLLGSTSQTLGSGAANTVSVSASCGAGTAARLCADLVLGGYSDWYLPSKNELDRLRANRATIGGFVSGSYWSSSESTVNNALAVNFNTGNAQSIAKNEAYNVRAIRSLTCPATPGAIAGTTTVCAGGTTTLSNATTGGTWSSSTPGIATVSASGVVTGVTAGTAIISYTVIESCGSASATRVVTVETTPSAGTITGAGCAMVVGNTLSLSSSVTGGNWSSSNSAVATVNSTGVVSGVANGTTTISYSVTNSCGTVAASTIVTVSASPLVIGASYGGGKIAYILQPGDPGYIAGETHGLIAAPSDQSTGINWGCRMTNISTSTAFGTGAANTSLITSICAESSYAARICADLVLGGYSDWYLPSREELVKIFPNRDCIGGFDVGPGLYWSSSVYDMAIGWMIVFATGETYSSDKNNLRRVRAVRSF